MARLTNPVWRWSDEDHVALRSDPISLAQQGTPGDDNIHGRRSPDTIDGFGGDDVLNGRGGDDTLDGGKGDDVLKGSTGADTLSGGSGNDSLYGGTEQQEVGAGRDQLDGGSGDDRIFGGFEEDLLTGGAGRDSFTYLEISDSSIGHADTVLDFQQGKDSFVFGGVFREAGDLHFIGSDPFSNAPGEVRTVEYSDHTSIFMDFDGDGQGDVGILVIGAIHFQASDFSF